ncbi:AAA domain-containing protein [Chaetomium tenue]|uniref:AAA domain-containing protein n=1 Tax=Chaetomium tenue TaxID=1854479 RepID=A0ACB7NYD9_9PEZI|nr:AAA domain-containing protein [Chaetomium globosum]
MNETTLPTPMSSEAETQPSHQPTNPVDTGGLRAVLIFGADQYVGKALVIAALCREIEMWYGQRTLYLQPLCHSPDTAPGSLSDCLNLLECTSRKEDIECWLSPLNVLCESPAHVIRVCNGETPDLDELDAARARSTGHSSMAYAVDEVQELVDFIKRHAPESGDDASWLFIDSVNGVMTPCFSGLPQAEVYRPLGFPVVLVGSRELNGVSLTISAFESLSLRGYNVVAVVMVTGGHWKNSRYVDQYFERYHPSVPVLTLPEAPAYRVGVSLDEELEEYHKIIYDSGALSLLILTLAAVYR